jgi:hypothetical protein
MLGSGILRCEKTAKREKKKRCFCYFLLTLEPPDVLIVPSVGSPVVELDKPLRRRKIFPQNSLCLLTRLRSVGVVNMKAG